MPSAKPSLSALRKEIAELRARLSEIEPVVRAIQSGEVDALVINDAQAAQVALIEGADSPYRLLLNEIDQGAFILTASGQALLSNRRVADLLHTAPERLIGAQFQSFLHPDDHVRFEVWLEQCALGLAKSEFTLVAADGLPVPTRLAGYLLVSQPARIYSVLVTDLSEHHQMVAQLAATTRELRRLAAHLNVAREEERTRIARELHDELGGSLTALKLDVMQLRKRSANPDDQASLTALAGFVDQMVQVVRRIATDLRPGLLDDLGLLPALEWQLAEFGRRSGLACRFNSPELDLNVPTDTATAVFRVFQETLTNVARHAQASRVDVELNYDQGYLHVHIQDDGRGISAADATSITSLGLLGMRERMNLVAGELDIRGLPGEGTRVLIRVPVPAGG